MAVWATLVVLAPASAWAEQPTVTSQARAANAEFLAFAPPPPDGAGAVCLVDTGVDLNPDTQSNVVERLALDGGDPGDVHHTKHGTSMAMVMGGPVNDWGSVGIWPHVKIVSIRAMPPGESSFPFNYYKRAVDMCRNRLGTGVPIRAINLSLGGGNASETEIRELRDYVLAARADNLSVVAAAGNDSRSVLYPAAIDEAIAVAAGTVRGELCSFSSRGPEVDLVAPGCETDVALANGRPAYGNGTSESAAITAAVLTALRSYRPDLSARDAEAMLVSAAEATPGGPALDAEAAFRAAGLGSVVEAGAADAPASAPSTSGDPTRPSVGATARRLPRPRLTKIRQGPRRLTLRLLNRPSNALVRVRVVYRIPHSEFSRRERVVERSASLLSLRLPRRWSRIELEYRSLEHRPSARLVLRARRPLSAP